MSKSIFGYDPVHYDIRKYVKQTIQAAGGVTDVFINALDDRVTTNEGKIADIETELSGITVTGVEAPTASTLVQRDSSGFGAFVGVSTNTVATPIGNTPLTLSHQKGGDSAYLIVGDDTGIDDTVSGLTIVNTIGPECRLDMYDASLTKMSMVHETRNANKFNQTVNTTPEIQFFQASTQVAVLGSGVSRFNTSYLEVPASGGIKTQMIENTTSGADLTLKNTGTGGSILASMNNQTGAGGGVFGVSRQGSTKNVDIELIGGNSFSSPASIKLRAERETAGLFTTANTSEAQFIVDGVRRFSCGSAFTVCESTALQCTGSLSCQNNIASIAGSLVAPSLVINSIDMTPIATSITCTFDTRGVITNARQIINYTFYLSKIGKQVFYYFPTAPNTGGSFNATATTSYFVSTTDPVPSAYLDGANAVFLTAFCIHNTSGAQVTYPAAVSFSTVNTGSVVIELIAGQFFTNGQMARWNGFSGCYLLP